MILKGERYMNTSYNQQVRTIVKVIPATVDRFTETKEKPKKRVCAYCRVSSDEEDQQSSYNLQVKHYTDFIKKNALWKFSGVYADEGISGTSIKNRTDFMRMIEDCKAGKIDMIITKSISRFARNTLDCLNNVRMLKGLSSPVGIYFEKENIDTLDSKSELLLTILSSLAQDESRSISENVRWSIQKRYQQGKFQCSTKFFLGYDTDKNGELIINEMQAKTIRRIYQETIEGNGINIIANGLMADKIKTGTGKTKWCPNSVYRILRNEKYCGDVLMQKRVTLDFLTHKRVTNKGHQPQYFIADHHPAIISKEDWNAVQIELDRRHNMKQANGKTVIQKYSNRSAFSNMLFCGICREPLIRRRLTSYDKNGKYLYSAWKCRVSDGRIKGMECKARCFREVGMEHAFMTMLQEMKNNQEDLMKEAKSYLADVDLNDWEKERLDFLKLQINTLDEQLSQVAATAQTSIASDVYDDISMKLTREIDALRTEWEKLNEKQHKALLIKRTQNWLMSELNKLKEFEPTSERIEFREDIFKRIVRRGDVFDDGNIIYELNIGITRTASNNQMRVWNFEKELENR